MPSRALLLALAAIGVLAGIAQGQSRITPGSMPSADRVMAEIKGKDPKDTAARQMGAFWQLRQIIETLAGPRKFSNQLTAEEKRLIGEYSSGYARAGQPYAQLQGADRPKWFEVHSFYEVDDTFRDELLERFLPPPLRAEYLKAKGTSDAQWLARSQAAQRERERVQVQAQAGALPQAAPSAPANPYQREEQMVHSLIDALIKGTTELATSVGTAPAAGATSSPAGKAAADEFHKGKARWEAKDYPTAISHFKKSIAHEPSSGAYFLLGRAQYDSKAYFDALLSFEKVTGLLPQNADARYYLGKTLLALGQTRNGEEFLRAAIRLKPDHFLALNELGMFFYTEKRHTEALESLQQLARLYPQESAPWVGLGFVYTALGRPDEAMQAYQRVAVKDKEAAAVLLAAIKKGSPAAPAPGTAEHLLNQAVRYRDAKDYPKAIEAAKRALELNPAASSGHLLVGAAYYQLGRLTDALPFVKEAVRLEPANAANLFWLGVTYYRLGDFQLALSSLQQSARLTPDDPYVHQHLGNTFSYGLKQYENAAEEYRRAIALKPDYSNVHEEFANTLLELDEPEEAVKMAQEAVRLAPKEDGYRLALARVYLELGRKEDALQIQRALEKRGTPQAKQVEKEIEAWYPEDADKFDVLLLLGTVVLDDKGLRSGLPYLRRALLLASTPKDRGHAHRFAAESNEGLKRVAKAAQAYERAAAEFQKALAEKPQDGDLHLWLGRMLLKLGRTDVALRIQRRLVALDSAKAQQLLEEIAKVR